MSEMSLRKPNSSFCSKCGTQLPSFTEISSLSTKTYQTPIKELARGSIFAGRYEVVEELGEGGMGIVYKALDKELREPVALKLLKPEIAADEKTIERFRNELKIARKITLPNARSQQGRRNILHHYGICVR